jgi:hypothetical protein
LGKGEFSGVPFGKGGIQWCSFWERGKMTLSLEKGWGDFSTVLIKCYLDSNGK